MRYRWLLVAHEMSNDEAYLASLFPNRFRAFRWGLKDFTLGHCLLLNWLESPFVVPDKDIRPADISLFIAVCSRRYLRARRMIYSPLRAWSIRRYYVPARFLMATLAEITEYIRHFSNGPKCWSEGTGKARGTYFYGMVKVTLMAKLHLTESQALEKSLPSALHDYAGVLEMDNRLQVVGSEQEDAMAAAKALAERKNGEAHA